MAPSRRTHPIRAALASPATLALAASVLAVSCGGAAGSDGTATPSTVSSDSDTTVSTDRDVSTSSVTEDDPADSPDDTGDDVTGPDEPSGGDDHLEAGELEGELVPEIIATYPHDATAFTQGLEWYGDLLLESTGLRGSSSLRLVDPTTGVPEALKDVDSDLFAEGVTVVDGRALQLTWTEETVLLTELEELDEPAAVTRRSDAYEGEGWGLCYDGESLVMSDGSSTLTFRDPETFDPLGEVTVTRDGVPVDELNELECVGDQVMANVWKTDEILVIDRESGEVVGTIDASALRPASVVDANDVLNGIAHHPDTDRFWLTGKRWPVMYEVDFVPAG